MIDEKTYQQLRAEGYTDQEIQEALNEIKTAPSPTIDPRSQAQTSPFAITSSENIIKWQLELDNILERMEHMLKNDRIVFDKGHVIWKATKDPTERVFNDRGVNEIMKILAMYLNRNTILADYDQQDINDIVYDAGVEISDLIYMKYQDMGMDTAEKRKLYPIIHRILVDNIRNAYQRALHGGERRSLREARQVSQIEQLTPQNIALKERGMLNPARYMFGKTK